MNITGLLTTLQARHDAATARAGELRDQIEHFTAVLAGTEARPAHRDTTRKVIAELAPPETPPAPPESTTAHRAIAGAVGQHPDPDQTF
ncbi:hypothetical protein [Streptomyces poonensis]|uniref:Uncharacterized protein n=1 Tax=Streptomyces poonensis TaxID=68255 RepID=A0A918Q2S5_9ACTN|nr:hypothetical protein [Streptomyces poonensis]GGZ29780.1 hypothetical protein GCM10010365_57710 [Streptomyces poonensis]